MFLRELGQFFIFFAIYPKGRSRDSDLFGSLICYYSLNNPVTDARYSGQLSDSCSFGRITLL